mmetsp:Transcript_97647/g.281003  ORF Transcript_97647/g.281003 Transcript_97647/m.281003 type:complete len:200 (-) Transcript_97647:883-1482(-)
MGLDRSELLACFHSPQDDLPVLARAGDQSIVLREGHMEHRRRVPQAQHEVHRPGDAVDGPDLDEAVVGCRAEPLQVGRHAHRVHRRLVCMHADPRLAGARVPNLHEAVARGSHHHWAHLRGEQRVWRARAQVEENAVVRKQRLPEADPGAKRQLCDAAHTLAELLDGATGRHGHLGQHVLAWPQAHLQDHLPGEVVGPL